MSEGYSAATARRVAKVTQRRLDYWDETGLVRPSVLKADGKGTERQYSFEDLVKLSVVARLRKAGLTLQRIRKGLKTMRALSGARDPLLCEVLLAEGGSLLRRVDGRTMEDVLRSGQFVFSVVAIGRVQDETKRQIESLTARDIRRRGRPRKRASGGNSGG
jgi:DNA-binding transcriptional MerR regulator